MSMNDMRGLWRGKRNDDGEWVKGDMSRLVSKNRYYIEDNQEDWVCEVDSSTLGECTGLTDKNGKLIFEGDIVEVDHPYNGKSIHKVVWHDFCWNLEDFRAACFDCPGFAFSEGTKYMTVVGNIHDNPELLKGAENNGSRG